MEGLPIINLDEALDKDLDVMIESGMQISTDQMHRMQKLNIKVASFRTGNDYFMIAEELIFQRPVSTMFMTLNVRLFRLAHFHAFADVLLLYIIL